VQTTYGNGSANRSVTLTNPSGTGQTRTSTSPGTNSQFVARSLNILTTVEEVPESDDVDKVNLAKAGDLQAFDVLILRHQGMISVLLFRFAGQRADLEDLVQETFIRAFRNIKGWQPHKPFSHWLKRIAVNVGRDYYRHNRISAQRVTDLPPEEIEAVAIPSSEPGTFSSAGSTQEAQWLLSKLNPDDRTLLTLHYLNGLPLREISEHLGWSVSKTKVRSLRAKRKLQRILETHGYTFS
jgi:RNA polymerase sigma-70 factor, ECF subfamily